MTAYEFTHIPDLTEEEKTSPYARFYYEPILPPESQVLAAIQPDNQIHPSLALAPRDLYKLFIPGSLEIDNGYCVIPDGTGFSIIHTRAQDTTLEMEKWWGNWFSSSDYNYLNYKIWMPSLHFSHAMPIYEDLGWGPVKIHASHGTTPDDLNLPAPPKELNSDFHRMVCGCFTIVPDDPNNKTYYATLVHYVTLGDNGMDTITCVWSGIHIIKGKPERKISQNETVDPEYVRLFACHNAWEFARKTQLLPKLYAYSQTIE